MREDREVIVTRATPLRGDRTWWRSVVADWWSAPDRREWTRLVNDDRIVNVDRIRPFVSRGCLLVVVASALLVADGPTWTLALLGFGVVQCALELAYEPIVRARHEATALGQGGTDLLVRIWYANYGTGISNVTGILGLVACVAGLWMVIWGSGPANDDVAFKVIALAAALAYTASGALGPLMDAAVYDPKSSIPSAAWRILRLAWIAVAATVIVCLVLADHSDGAFGEALPYACLTVVIAYYPMLRVREYERAVTAAWHVAEKLEHDRVAQVAVDLHSLLQPVKDSLLLARDALTDPAERRDVTEYVDDVSAVYRAAREGRISSRDGFMPPLEERLRRITRPHMVTLETDIALDMTVPDADYRRARQLLATCVENSVQAYVLWAGNERPRITTHASVSGTDLVVEVGDLLPLVDDQGWSGDGTLASFRREIEECGGSFEQHEHGAGKLIRASWNIIEPLRTRASHQIEEQS